MSDSIKHALVISDKTIELGTDWEAIRRWSAGDGLLWVHLAAEADESRSWISEEAGLPKLVPQALIADETRPRASVTGDGLVLILRGVNLNPGADPEDMVSIRLWVDANRVISTCLRPLMSVTDVVESLDDAPLEGPGHLVTRLCDRLVERMGDVLDGLEERVADLEQDALQEADSALRSKLTALRREAIALRRYLAPQREALGRLQGEPLSWLTDYDRLRLREVNDRLIRYLEDLDAIRERAAVVQEELISVLSDQMNKRMYLLSVVAALFLPLGFLTGLLGVNLGGLPGADHPWGFTIFMLFLAALIALQLWYFLRKRWF